MARLTVLEILICLGSGALTALSMPGLGVVPVVGFSLVPLFFVLRRRGGFLPGFLFGLAFLAIDLRWIVTLTRFYPVVIAGYMAAVTYLALGYGLIGFILRRTQRNRSWTWTVVAPCLFVLVEFARTLGPLGIGFSTLYSSLYRVPWLIQSAAYLGPWFITGLLAAVNGSLFLAWVHRSVRYLFLAAGLALILAAFDWLPSPADGEGDLRVAVVSSTVDQKVKLDGRNLQTVLARYLKLGHEALDANPQLIVFPESILPAFTLQNPDLKETFFSLARSANARVLLGTGDYRNRSIYNSVAVFSPEGVVEGVYDMVRPVPFGEVIPGRRALERVGLGDWLRSFLPMDLSRGSGHHPISTPIARWGTPICYEITFPTPSRSFVRRGAEALITIANDAWFDGSSALNAHFSCVIFRAVETRRWVVQSANGGISGIVSPTGRIQVSTQVEEVIHGRIGLSGAQTPYSRWGDGPVIGFAGLWVAFSLALQALQKRRQTSRGKQMPLAP